MGPLKHPFFFNKNQCLQYKPVEDKRKDKQSTWIISFLIQAALNNTVLSTKYKHKLFQIQHILKELKNLKEVSIFLQSP